MEAVREGTDGVHFLGPSDLLAAFAERSKYRNSTADRIFDVNLGARAISLADEDSRAADIVQLSILHPEFVEIARVDRNG